LAGARAKKSTVDGPSANHPAGWPARHDGQNLTPTTACRSTRQSPVRHKPARPWCICPPGAAFKGGTAGQLRRRRAIKKKALRALWGKAGRSNV
jgi:hypothetical protein